LAGTDPLPEPMTTPRGYWAGVTIHEVVAWKEKPALVLAIRSV
jgi:hypothetical protein